MNIGILNPYADSEGKDGLRLSELGRLFEDETLALFFSPAVKHALTARPDLTHSLVAIAGRPAATTLTRNA